MTTGMFRGCLPAVIGMLVLWGILCLGIGMMFGGC